MKNKKIEQSGVGGPVDLLSLDEALERLAQLHPAMREIVELRFFAGLPMRLVAEVLDRPLRSVEREWQTARVWLHREMT